MKRKGSKRKHQKLYRMKGCSSKTQKKHLGGSADLNLAYTNSIVPTVPNPFLSYIGKGGALANINGVDKTIPNGGPPANGFNFLNPQGTQRGGCCGSCGGAMTGGCATCGGAMTGGNQGIPYPNGLVGSPWSGSSSGWPGVNGVQGDSNHIAVNDYKTDISRQMIATGANPPFSVGGRGRRRGTRKSRKSRKGQRGGTLSNFLGQDLINLGRQFQFGVGSAYNTLAGYSAPVSPLPWRDQLSSTTNLSTLKAASL
jgi:hypothetical protein